jgi:hypothetical protein
MVRRVLVALVDGALACLDLGRALLGLVRFALVCGLSPGYLRRRGEWFSRKMAGRPIGWRGLLAFGLWHAEVRRGRSFPREEEG